MLFFGIGSPKMYGHMVKTRAKQLASGGKEGKEGKDGKDKKSKKKE